MRPAAVGSSFMLQPCDSPGSTLLTRPTRQPVRPHERHLEARRHRASGCCVRSKFNLQQNASESQQPRRIFAEDHFALCVWQIDLFEKLQRALDSHVEAIVAADHYAPRAYFADHEF